MKYFAISLLCLFFFCPNGLTGKSLSPGIEIIKKINGMDANSAPGPIILVPPASAPPINFSFQVVNTGDLTLVNVIVTDNVFGSICSIASLAPGESHTCTLSADADLGLHHNIATATGQPVDAGGQAVGDPVSDNDEAWYTGVFINLSLSSDQYSVCPGEVIQFTLAATMLGGTSGLQLRNVMAADFNLPLLVCNGPHWAGGDLNGNCMLDFTDANGDGISEEFFSWKYNHGVNANFTNTGNVLGEVWYLDPFNGAETFIGSVGNTAQRSIMADPALCGEIGNFVWHDLDGNGMQSAGEPGIPNVSVTLTGTTVDFIGVTLTTVSTANGNYTFNGLIPGTYVVAFGIPSGFVPTGQFIGGMMNGCSAIDFLGSTPVETITQGELNHTLDAGFFSYCSLGNFVWNDSDGDGLQDAGEPGIPGVTVMLGGATGDGMAVTLTTLTNNTGQYLFAGLEPGTYALTFVTPPGGYVLTTSDAGGDNNADSDAVSGTQTTSGTTVVSGETDLTWDAGFYRYCSLGNFVWDDLNENAIQDAGEPGIPAVSLTLLGVSGDGQIITLTTETDGSGNYAFTQLKPGAYRLYAAPVSGRYFVQPDQGSNDFLDSDFSPQTLTSPLEQLVSGEANDSYDAGTSLDNIIQGKITIDQDGDCAGDVGEPGGTNVPVQAVGANQTYYGWTQPNGTYRIGVPPGLYTVAAMPSLTGASICANDIQALIDVPGTNVTINFSEKLPDCPLLEANLSTIALHPCKDAVYVLNYRNNSGVAAEAYVDLELHPLLELKSATAAHIALGANRFRFVLGIVEGLKEGSIKLDLFVSCDAINGQTLCSNVRIFPPAQCLPVHPDWSGALIGLRSQCDLDSLRFTLKNIGNGPMQQMLEYVIVEDGIMGLTQYHPPLNPGDSLVVSVPANGSTWRLEALQEIHATGKSRPVASVEACGTNVNFSTGYVNQFVNDELDLERDVDCSTVVSAGNQLQKLGIPLGYGPQKLIERETEIEYRLSFTNYSAETIQKVTILDILPGWLDPLSLWPMSSSHPFQFDLSDTGSVWCRFDSLNLPSFQADPQAAQGFVKFRVKPRADAPIGAVIENKARLWLENTLVPGSGNTTTHRIGENYVLTSLWTTLEPEYAIGIMPNPGKESAWIYVEGPLRSGTFLIELYDLQGRLLRKQSSDSGQFRLDLLNFPSGVMKCVVWHEGRILGNGTLIKAGE